MTTGRRKSATPEKVDYGCKTEAQNLGSHGCIYCAILQTRWQQALERIADGFVHPCPTDQTEGKGLSQEA